MQVVAGQPAEPATPVAAVEPDDVVAKATKVESATPISVAPDIASEPLEVEESTKTVAPELAAAALDPLSEDTFTPRPRPATVPRAVLRELAAERAAGARQAASREASRRAAAERADARRAAAERASFERRAARKEAARGRTAAEDQAPGARRSPSRASGTSRASASAGTTAGNRRSGYPGQNRRAMSSYTSRVHAHLARHKRSPRGDESGTVTVSFTIAASGSAGGVRIARSSGSAALDSEALAMVQRASPFPAIPAEIGRSSMSFSVPVRYR